MPVVNIPWQMMAQGSSGPLAEGQSVTFTFTAPDPIPDNCYIGVAQPQIAGANAFMAPIFNGQPGPGDMQNLDFRNFQTGVNTLLVTAQKSSTPGFTAELHTGHKKK